MDSSTNLPIIAGVLITTDEHGRYNLNAIHKASHLGEHKRPSKWLATNAAKELITEFETQSPNTGLAQNSINTVKGGIAAGTFAHELLAISYAGWISPTFQLQVNQAFLDSKQTKNPALPNFSDPAEAARAWASQYEKTKEANKKLVQADHEIQRLQGVCHTIAAQFQQGMTPVNFCKQLNGVNVRQVQTFLSQKGMLFKDNLGWRVASYYRDSWFTERLYNQDPQTQRVKIYLTKKGATNLYKLYLKDELPMKATWDGNKSHCLFEEQAVQA